MASIRRVSVCANQASSLIRLLINDNNINITAQDLDYSTAAEDNLPCQYDGYSIEIGFKAPFLLDILANLHTQEVEIQLADATRPGLIVPVDSPQENQTLLMLLMPMMANN